MLFGKIGDKISALEQIPLRGKEVDTLWNMRTDGLQVMKSGKPFGPVQQTLRNWKAGEKASDAKVYELVEVLNNHTDLRVKLTVSDFSDDVDVASFAKMIGFDAVNAFRTRATAWAERNIGGKGSGFLVREDENQHLIEKENAGLYTIKVMAGRDTSISYASEMRLAVTFVAPASTRKNEKKRFLYCELSVGSASVGGPYLFQGAVSRRMQGTNWKFVQETSEEPRAVLMMTEKAMFSQGAQITGEMISMPLSGPLRPVGVTVKIERCGHFRDVNDIESFLAGHWTPAQIVHEIRDGREQVARKRASGNR